MLAETSPLPAVRSEPIATLCRAAPVITAAVQGPALPHRARGSVRPRTIRALGARSRSVPNHRRAVNRSRSSGD